VSCSISDESGQETASSRKDLSDLRTAVRLAKEMGKGMGGSKVLQ